jgi:hypothetical protein
MTEKGLTASQYLDHPDFGPGGSLKYFLELSEIEEIPSGKYVREALIAKNRLLDGTLLVNEYENLIRLIIEYYPNSFVAWIDSEIKGLLDWRQRGNSLKGENEFPEALQPYFKSRLKEKKLHINFVWIPNP